VRAVELWWNLQVRSGKPDPLAADIVHVGEDRRNGAGLAGRLALQAVGSRCSIRIWFMRSLAAKIWTAAGPS
jgi:hypothetical protein